MYRSDFLNILEQRGYIHQITHSEALDQHLANQHRADPPRRAYIGFDATADCLHIGSLVQIMMLRWLQKTGHQPMILLGDGTSKIGDPSGKDTQRKMLSETEIRHNAQGILSCFKPYLQFDACDNHAIVCYNSQWLNQLNYITLLREVGIHFTVNRMLTFDSVRTRLERQQPLSFLEFNYMILQAYDFAELARQQNCTLQLGGADQWGNIVCGVELARRLYAKTCFGLTSPLLTTVDGKKMGKTADGAIWLAEQRTSIDDFWQYWRNTADADVGRFLRLFTEIDLDEIASVTSGQGAELNRAKKLLATEATGLLYGRTRAIQAQARAEAVFEGGQLEQAQRIDGNLSRLAPMTVAEALTDLGLCQSRSAARRLIAQGGVRLNEKLVGDPQMSLQAFMSNDTAQIVIALGKKRRFVLDGSAHAQPCDTTPPRPD